MLIHSKNMTTEGCIHNERVETQEEMIWRLKREQKRLARAAKRGNNKGEKESKKERQARKAGGNGRNHGN